MKLIFTYTILSIVFILQTQAQKSFQDDLEETAEQFLPKKYILATANPFLNYSTSYSYLNNIKYEKTLGIAMDSIEEKWRTAVPIVTIMSNPLENEDAFEYDMRSALMMGIDGFKFKYKVYNTATNKENFRKVFASYIKVAEENDILFKFSIELIFDRPKSYSSDQLFEDLQKDLNQILTDAKFSKKILRTGNDKIIFFTKNTEKAIDINSKKSFKENLIENPNLIKEISDKFESIKQDLYAPVTFVYETKYLDVNTILPQILNYFPAIIASQYLLNNEQKVENAIRYCKQNNRIFIPTVIYEEQSSQLYTVDKTKLIKKNTLEANANKNNQKKLISFNHKFTSTFRRLMEQYIREDVGLINVNSWNDYEKGTHIAPDIHHRYLTGILLKYYKKVWLDERYVISQDIIGVSFKNYYTNQLNKTNTIKVDIRSNKYSIEDSDSIEVVTLLKEEGFVFINGKKMGIAPKGIHVIYIPKKEGEITVQIKRKGTKPLLFKTPKKISGLNERADIMTYSFSSIDKQIDKLNFNMILKKEMKVMYNRFLLSSESQRIWTNAAFQRFQEDLNTLLNFGNQPEKVMILKEKSYDKYKVNIKPLLDEFQYEIWLDIEKSARKNIGIQKEKTDQNNVLKGYNQLEAIDFK